MPLSVNLSLPAGAVAQFAGSVEPSGWIFAAGQALSRTGYAGLYAAIGTTYGAGDGVTTFNAPDMRGRVGIGRDNMGGTAANRVTTANSGLDGAALGAAGGGETRTITAAQMPSHTHAVTPVAVTSNVGGLTGYVSQAGPSNTGVASTSTATGGGGALSVIQPAVILNWIIKT